MAAQTGRFQPVDRLRRSVEFQRVISKGRRVAGAAFVVVCAQRKDGHVQANQVRLGITVSRKVGNAVVRNRVKRRIREWFRASRGALGAGLDLVVIGRVAAAGLPSDEFGAELSKLSNASTRSLRPTGAA